MKTSSKHILSITLLIAALPMLQACMVADDELIAQDQRYGGSARHPIMLHGGKARVAKCGVWEDVTDTSQNLQSPNHGCATQNNIAAMIAKPSDLTKKPKLGSRNSTLDIEAVKSTQSSKRSGGLFSLFFGD
jgi:hypothetical protein